MRREIAKMQADFTRLAASMDNARKMASAQDRPDLYRNQLAQLAQVRQAYNLAAASSGQWNTQTVKTTSATEMLTNKIRQQKLTVTDLFRNWKTLQTDVYKQQIALRNSIATQFGGNMFGKQDVDLHTPKNLGPELDNARVKYGLITEQIRSAARNTVNWGKNMQWAGRQITVGIGVPLGIAAVGAAALALQVDSSLTRVAKVYDTTATQGIAKENELAALRENSLNMATELAQKYGASVQEVIDAEAELAASGLRGSDLMRSTSEAVRIATLGELDYQSAIQMTISLQTAFGLSAEQLTEAFDFMNSVENSTSLSIQDIAEATPRAASALAALGGTVQDMTVMLVAMRESGVDAAEGANAIKSATSRLLNPTAAAVSYFRDTFQIDLESVVNAAGGNIYKIMQDLAGLTQGYDELAKQRGIQELFGTYQFNRVTALWDNLGAAMNDTTGTVNQTAQAMRVAGQDTSEWASVASGEIAAIQESAAGRFKSAVETIKAQLIPLGQTVLEFIIPVMHGIGNLIEAFNNMNPALQGVILGGAGLLALGGILAMFVGIMGNAVGTLVGFLGGLAQLRFRFKALSAEEAANMAINRGMSAGFDKASASTAALAFTVRDLTNALTQSAVAAGTMMTATGRIGQRQVIQNAAGQHVYAPGSVGASGNRLDGMRASQADSQMFLTRGVQQSQQIVENTDKAGRNMRIASKAASGLMIGGLATSLMADSSNDTAQQFGVIASSAGLILSLVGPGLGAAFSRLAAGAGGFGGGLRAALGTSVRLFGPAGLLIAGIALFARLTDEANNLQQAQEAIANSAQTWMDLAGEGELYQEDVALDQATTDSYLGRANAVEKLKEANEELYKAAGELSGAQAVLNAAMQQGIDVIDSGGSLAAAQNAMNTFIQAAAEQGTISDVELQDLLVRVGDINLENPDEVQEAFRNILAENLQTAAGGNSGGVGEFGNVVGDIFSNLFSGNWQGALHAGSVVGMSDAQLAAIANSVEIVTERLGNEIGNRAAQGRIFDEFETEVSAQRDAALNNIITGMNIDTNGFNLDQLRQAINDGLDLDQIGVEGDGAAIMVLTSAIEDQSQARQELIYQMARAHGMSEEQARDIDSLDELQEALGYKTLSLADATRKWSEMMKKAKGSGKEVSEQMRVTAMESLAAASGMSIMDAALSGMFGPATRSNLQAIAEMIKRVKNEAAGGLTRGAIVAPTSKLTTAFSDRESQQALRDAWRKKLADEAEKAGEARQKAIDKAGEARQKALQEQSKAEDKAFEQREKALDAHWDSLEKQTKERQESETKVLEEGFDARIQVLKDQIEAEQDAEEKRQKIFEAEEKRIARIAARANRNIDFNVALNSGNMDEAAKLYNDSQAETSSWAIEDQQDVSQTASELRQKVMQDAIDAIEKEKDARLEALKVVQEAENEALKLRRQAVEDQLKEEREAARERIQAAQEAAREATQAAQESARAQTAAAVDAANRFVSVNAQSRSMDTSNMRNQIPTNQAIISDGNEKTRLKALALAGQLGGIWTGVGGVLAGALVAGAERGRVGAASVDWKGTGDDIANRVSGTVGLDVNGLKAWLKTGDYPGANWKKAVLASRHEGGIVRHDGGPTWTSKERTGIPRSASLYPSEVSAVLKRGEFVVNEKATRNNIGLLTALNNGETMQTSSGANITNREGAVVRHEGGMWAPGAIAAMHGESVVENFADKLLQTMTDLTNQAPDGFSMGGAGGGDAGSGKFVTTGNYPAAIQGKVSSNTAQAVQWVRSKFGINNIGTLGSRPNKSDHPMGKAMDVMIANYKSDQGIAQGNAVARAFIENPNMFGTKYVIWRDRITSGQGWGKYTHPNGPNNNDTLQHRDHVHVSLKHLGGLEKGASFTLPQLSNGGFIKYDNTLANLHAGEAVLTKPLTESFKETGGVASGGAGQYNISIDMRGATVREDIDIKSAVYAAIDEKERKLGRRRVIG